jgi:hypothetical protein
MKSGVKKYVENGIIDPPQRPDFFGTGQNSTLLNN